MIYEIYRGEAAPLVDLELGVFIIVGQVEHIAYGFDLDPLRLNPTVAGAIIANVGFSVTTRSKTTTVLTFSNLSAD